MKILVIDVGGTNIKVLVSGQKDPIKIPSGATMTAKKMVTEVKKATAGMEYDAVSIGYPGAVHANKPVNEPHNLAPGWVRFDFKRAFGRPVKVINDAAMQALGSYKKGRMLFLGLGTGLGSTLVIEGLVEPMELAHLPYKNGKTYEEYVGAKAMKKRGKKKWRKSVEDVVMKLRAALEVDEVVLGGGNARLLKTLPKGVRLGKNANAFKGGFRMWETDRRTR